MLASCIKDYLGPVRGLYAGTIESPAPSLFSMASSPLAVDINPVSSCAVIGVLIPPRASSRGLAPFLEAVTSPRGVETRRVADEFKASSPIEF